MENFTTQEHKRDSAGNVVVDNPGKTIANMREEHKNRNFVNGIIISAMALTVVLTGTMLGATAAHNKDLKSRISTLELENQSYISQRADANMLNRSIYNNDKATTNTMDNGTMTESNKIENDSMRTIWLNRKYNPNNNLTKDYTSRTYINRYYNPNTNKSDFISKEVNTPVTLPVLNTEPVANLMDSSASTTEKEKIVSSTNQTSEGAMNPGTFNHRVTNL